MKFKKIRKGMIIGYDNHGNAQAIITKTDYGTWQIREASDDHNVVDADSLTNAKQVAIFMTKPMGWDEE